MTPKLIIHSITYNHEKYIAQTLDGFVMQQTNFPFVAIVADDCSTDGTAAIIKEYAIKYPDIIVPILNWENVGSHGNWFNIASNYNAYYIALCEGDDYWTDPHKLQKQVDFLDANPDYSVCFHPVEVIYEDGSPNEVFPENHPSESTFADLIKGNFIQTNSAAYRWRFFTEKLPKNLDDIMPLDYYIHLLHAKIGKIKMLPDVMSVYRRHSGGIWSSLSSHERHKKYGMKEMNFYAAADKLGDYEYSTQLKPQIDNLFASLLHYSEIKFLSEIIGKYPQYMNNIVLIYKKAISEQDKYRHKYKKYKKYKKYSTIILIIFISLFVISLFF